MDWEFTEDQKRFQREVREFLEKELTQEAINETESSLGFGSNSRAFLKKLGRKGWLAASIPKAYGGMGAAPIERFIFMEEMTYYRAPTPGVGVMIAAPTIMLFGTEEQKKQFLPEIASGEADYALGYSELNAGSDLASLEITAKKDGDDFLINGTKIYNTACHYAKYHWLGARTDSTAAKHKGISLFIVDMNSPGIMIEPMERMDGGRTNRIAYKNVRVPRLRLIGELNKGWYHIATALDFERVSPTGEMRRTLDDLIEYAKDTKRAEVPLSKDPLIRQKLAGLKVEVEVAKVLNYRVAWLQEKGIVPNYQASMSKMFNSELYQRICAVGLEIMDLYGQLRADSKWAPLRGIMEKRYRTSIVSTIVRGTSEIMRQIIALRGLELPRAK